MMYLGIDPGTHESAVIQWESGRVIHAEIKPNDRLLHEFRTKQWGGKPCCEMIACYGMAVGKEVFETCVWIGRFWEALGTLNLVYRRDIKTHFCNSMKAKDSNVAQALRDQFGQVGTKKNPGPLYGVKSHLWSALAVAAYAEWFEEQKLKAA